MDRTDDLSTTSRRLSRGETRVDPAHVMLPSTDGSVGSPPVLEKAPLEMASVGAGGNLADAFVEQVQNQAAELGSYLQQQQLDLDHRESEHNARIASFENQMRSARLWLDDRESELQSRESKILEQEEILTNRLAELGLVNEADDGIVAVENELTRRARELLLRESEVQQTRGELIRRRTELEQQATQTEVRRHYLDNIEKLLTKEHKDFANARRQLEEERTQIEQEKHAAQQQVAAHLAKSEAALSRRELELEHRTADLDNRETAAERFHAEVAAAQRDVLEMRLATEQVWAQLAETISAEGLTQTISETRSKLADHYSLAKAELRDQKEQLQQVAAQLVDQHDSLRQSKDELDEWTAKRQHEMDERAEQLEAKARKLARSSAHEEELKLRWHEERLSYQQQVRELTAKLRPLDSALIDSPNSDQVE